MPMAGVRQLIHRVAGKVFALTEANDTEGGRDLTGDRDIEWSYCASRVGRYALPRAAVLDFGCGGGFLTQAAGSLGCEVLAVDLMPAQFDLVYQDVEFRESDVMDLSESEHAFDLVINCSTIEHVGLGGRYGSGEDADGDLAAMGKLRRLMKPDSRMVLTLPVGLDAVFAPFHRVYGEERLARLFEGFDVAEEDYLRKDERNTWFECSRQEATSDIGTERYYALGLMVLTKAASA